MRRICISIIAFLAAIPVLAQESQKISSQQVKEFQQKLFFQLDTSYGRSSLFVLNNLISWGPPQMINTRRSGLNMIDSAKYFNCFKNNFTLFGSTKDITENLATGNPYYRIVIPLNITKANNDGSPPFAKGYNYDLMRYPWLIDKNHFYYDTFLNSLLRDVFYPMKPGNNTTGGKQK
jgi:hypothetical protein